MVIVVSGTLGDHVPLVDLARELTARGHRVRVGCNPAMRALVEDAGLAWFELGDAGIGRGDGGPGGLRSLGSPGVGRRFARR